jgi:hypothetical protein
MKNPLALIEEIRREADTKIERIKGLTPMAEMAEKIIGLFPGGIDRWCPTYRQDEDGNPTDEWDPIDIHVKNGTWNAVIITLNEIDDFEEVIPFINFAEGYLDHEASHAEDYAIIRRRTWRIGTDLVIMAFLKHGETTCKIEDIPFEELSEFEKPKRFVCPDDASTD